MHELLIPLYGLVMQMVLLIFLFIPDVVSLAKIITMSKSSRREFLNKAAVTGVVAVAGTTLSSFDAKSDLFIHHVYFWLKNTGSAEDRTKLVEGLTKLSKVKTIRKFYISQPAATNRPVIDSSYAISWLCFFDNKVDQDSYQTDPIHLKFVEDYSGLWSKVIVYDSIDL